MNPATASLLAHVAREFIAGHLTKLKGSPFLDNVAREMLAKVSPPAGMLTKHAAPPPSVPRQCMSRPIPRSPAL